MEIIGGLRLKTIDHHRSKMKCEIEIGYNQPPVMGYKKHPGEKSGFYKGIVGIVGE